MQMRPRLLRRRNERRRPGRRLAGLAAAGTLLLGVGCAEEVVEQPEIARPVKILQVGGSGVALRLEYPGSISTDQKVDMAFEVSGKIIEFPVNEGQTVARGTMLAKLDPRDFQASVNAATAAKNAAKAELDRRQALFDADVSPKSELDIAQRDYELTFARVDKSEKALEDSMLKAPLRRALGMGSCWGGSGWIRLEKVAQ